jgi:UDP-glucose 4-epimerase
MASPVRRLPPGGRGRAPVAETIEMAHHLVLGGSGFIGRHLAASLAKLGHDVVVTGRKMHCELPADVPASALSFKTLDLETANWEALIANCDVIHHCAWSTIPQTAIDNPLADLDTNVRSTLQLLETLRHYSGKRLIFVSSAGTVYGKVLPKPVSEDHPLRPITAYGVSKVAVEKYLEFYHNLHGLDCRIARISNPFGVGQNLNNKQGAATTFVMRACAGENITIWGDGQIIRDYIHIADLTEALIALATVPLDKDLGLPVFNIATGVGISLNQLVGTIRRYSPRPFKVEYAPGRPFDIPVSILNVSRAEKLLGWRRRLSFEQGIELTIQDVCRGRRLYSTLFSKISGARLLPTG